MHTNLPGLYKWAKSSLLGQSSPLELVIGTRRTPSPQKPRNYLLQRISPGEHIYISSLYPMGEIDPAKSLQGYSFDWQGGTYTLIIDQAAGTAKIAHLSPTPTKACKEGAKD